MDCVVRQYSMREVVVRCVGPHVCAVVSVVCELYVIVEAYVERHHDHEQHVHDAMALHACGSRATLFCQERAKAHANLIRNLLSGITIQAWSSSVQCECPHP